MLIQDPIQVALDKELVQQLLNGLYHGAFGKALKVVIGVNGNYHVSSKDLRMELEIDETGTAIKSIQIHNSKQRAVITASDLESMGLTDVSREVVKEIKLKYSSVFHSLADNIVVFNRTYGSN